MNPDKPLLMIPGPVEVSPAVLERLAEPPPGHLAPALIEAFGGALELMRQVWRAGPDSQPFIVAGGGTAAMDMAVANLFEPGERALLVVTGYFSDRLGEMLRRLGVTVAEVRAEPGDAPAPELVGRALEESVARAPLKALLATHVDTSTGVRVDPRPLLALAREHGLLSVIDGVCATAGERFEMEAWGADVYLTASQKAIGLPPGLALMVVSRRALEARARRRASAPPMILDWETWRPVMEAYERRRPAYFSTPATGLVSALELGLREILGTDPDRRVRLHERAGAGMRAAWRALDLTPVPVREELCANTMSALWFPPGVDATLLGRVRERGVVVAAGLHSAIRERYFRVGHMGYAVERADLLERTAAAVGQGLRDAGLRVEPDAALAALRQHLG